MLRDGSTVHVRPTRPEDERALFAFFKGLSQQSRWFRFFAAGSDTLLAEAAREQADVDYARTFALIATTGPDDRIVGHAFYASTDAERAEVAFAITETHQGRGLGTILLGQLAEVAVRNGLRVFDAFVLAENHRMLEVFRESGFPVEVQAEPGELHVTLPTALTEEALERFEQREQIAAANALLAFFNPGTVAVIGASRRRGTVGGELFHNLLTSGFPGAVYAVNAKASVVQSVPAYPSVEAIPGPLDLAVLVVPGDEVAAVAEQCARKGVRALVVISSGFAETGGEGSRRQANLLRVCRTHGMRLIGPNCMGIINTDPEVCLNATFASRMPPAGRVAFLSQSGALGLAVIDHAASLGLGISTFASVGNKADISGNDLLGYWQTDPRTDVILLYLESFGNPRKFSRTARHVARTKPIAVVKSGRSRAGSRAASSHTGALLAASDVTVDALFRQAGVIRTDTLEELFDVASLLANQPVPRGRRVGIVTNAGGPAILCADACEAEGLEVPVLSESSQARLRRLLRPEASVGNPVDMVASATADHYREAIRIVASDSNVDALVVIFIPPLVTAPEDVARAIAEGARALKGSKPVLAVFMSARGVPDALRTADVRVPSYAFPEDAAIALARVARYGEWLSRPLVASAPLDDLRRDEAAATVAIALKRGPGWLTPDEVTALLSCYGLRTVEQRLVTDPVQAGAAAQEIGPPVALKAVAPEVVHKTEVGAVRLGLQDADEVRRAAEEVTGALRARGHSLSGFLVQRMAAKGVEMILGIAHDPQFGPLIACGAGGVLVELVRDVSVRLTPVSRQDASEMIRSLKTYPLLVGFRGAQRCDVGALEEALVRLGTLADDLPQVAELDCNPIVVGERGAVIVDARVRVAPSEPPPPLGARR